MKNNKRINWWAILAVAVITVPLGYVGTGVIKKLTDKQDTIANRDTILSTPPQPEPQPVSEKLFLSVTKHDIRMESNGGSETIDVNSNVEWKVISGEGSQWLTISPLEGRDNGIVTVSTNNNAGKKRSASLVIQWRNDNGDTMTETINITQEKKINVTIDNPIPPIPPRQFLNVNTSQVSFGQIGGTKSVSIKSNMVWHIQMIGGDGWLDVNTTQGNGSKSVSLTATANPSTEPRLAKVSILGTDDEGNNVNKTINITQSGKKPLPEPISKQAVQAIVSGGRTDRNVPDGCIVVVNETTQTTYSAFRNKVRKREYTGINVNNVGYDANNIVKHISISATQNSKPAPDNNEQLCNKVITVLKSGDSNSLIPATSEVIVNGKRVAYIDFARSVKKGTRTDIKLIGTPKTNAKGEVVEVSVSAIENNLSSEQ